MTEAAWLASTDIWSMARFLKGRASDRKLRLFACACCRMVWGWMTDARSRQAVEIAEQLADGNDTLKNLSEVAESSYAAFYEAGHPNAALSRIYAAWVANMATAKPLHTEDVIQHTALVAGWNAVPEKDAISDDSALDDPAWDTAYDNSMKQEACLLRDIFGNPFRPVSLDASVLAWNDSTIPKLAQGVYEDRAFDRLPHLGRRFGRKWLFGPGHSRSLPPAE